MALRQRPWQDGCTPDADMVELADQVIKCGLAHLNKDAFMLVLSSSFLIDVQASYQSGFTTLQVRPTQLRAGLWTAGCPRHHHQP